MPEIAEAQALFAALAKTDEVKVGIVERERRLDLQTSFGRALMWGKGFAAEETKAAIARAEELAGRADTAQTRFAGFFEQIMSNCARGEYRLARETAETFLQDAEARGSAKGIDVARRTLGLVLLFEGDLTRAQAILVRMLAAHNLAVDAEVGAAAFLSLTEWHLGEVEHARQLIDRATCSANEMGHVLTVANARVFKTILESRRNDAAATLNAAETVLALAEERGIKTFADLGQVYANWARGRLFDPKAGARALRQALG
jgi:hypothetical protein